MQSFVSRILESMKPLIRFIDRFFTIPVSIKAVTGDHYFLWRDKIHCGYVFLTSAYGNGSNLINPGRFKHAGIYFGRGLKTALLMAVEKAELDGNTEMADRLRPHAENPHIKDDICYVLESVTEGVVITNLVTFLTTKDLVNIYKPLFASVAERRMAALKALESIGLPYDYGFTEYNDAKYCYELAAKSYEEVTGIRLKRVVYKFLGIKLHEVFLADTFIEDTEKWECLIKSEDYDFGH